MKRVVSGVLAVMVVSILAAPAGAQEDEVSWIATLEQDARKLGDLEFPTEAAELGSFGDFHNGLFKPSGKSAGPFPTLVLAHTCGGIRAAEMRYWVEAALQEGYAVLVVDSMRGHKNNCYPPAPVPAGRRLKDLYDAIAHLAKLPFVDAARIAEAGFSQGAFMAGLLASPKAKQAVAPEAPRYAASAGLYGTCEWPPGSLKNTKLRIRYVFDDTDRPLLFLMGDEDRETPAEYCGALLPALKAQGAPVEWHLYPGVTHCWDCTSLDGFSKVDHKGERVSYRYDKATTEDSRRRLFDFLARSLKK